MMVDSLDTKDILAYTRSKFSPYGLYIWGKDLVSKVITNDNSMIENMKTTMFWWNMGQNFFLDYTKVKYIVDNNKDKIVYFMDIEGNYHFLDFKRDKNDNICSIHHHGRTNDLNRLTEVNLDSNGNII